MDIQVLTIVLLLALLLTGAWGWQERRARRAIRPPPGPGPEEAAPSPLFVALATALDDGVLLVAPDRRIAFANQAAGRLLGTPGTRLDGRTVIAALRDYHADQAIERALVSGEPQTVTFQVARSGRMLRLTCQPLADAEVRALVVLYDVTRVAQLERARREMVANISHELRTPLASIRLLVETLASEPPPDLARRMLGQVDDELVALTQLVDELRELSQIESGRLMLKLAPTAVRDLVARVVDRLRQQAERRRLTLACEVPPDLPPILADEDRIGQVLINLVHNAVKFTQEGGTITVSADVGTPRQDERTMRELQRVEGTGWIRLTVRDTGPGIPPGEIERIFERFYKVDRARTRDSGGTGLGLAIAKHLVERHGGRIWAESRDGQGSAFHMLLPRA